MSPYKPLVEMRPLPAFYKLLFAQIWAYGIIMYSKLPNYLWIRVVRGPGMRGDWVLPC